MSQEIDPVLGSFIGLSEADLSPEAPDAVEQLFENAKLDSAFGKAGTAVALRTQTAQFHAEAEKLLKHESAPAPASRIVKDDTLEKTYGTHSERKRTAYRHWIAGELALHKSVSELADYARRYSPESAALIEEIGAELEAA